MEFTKVVAEASKIAAELLSGRYTPETFEVLYENAANTFDEDDYKHMSYLVREMFRAALGAHKANLAIQHFGL